MRRKTNTKNRRDQPGNDSGNHQRASMPNEPPVDYDRKNGRKAKQKNMCV